MQTGSLHLAGRGQTIAVMQPYFFPYAGYFRLMAVADHFIVFDCVQFPRRGWVHRCLVPSPAGADEWLTLPIASCPRETTIKELRFAGDARASLDARLARYPWIASGQGKAAETVRAHLASPLEDVTTFLIAGLKLVCNVLGFSPTVTRSSSLGLDPLLRGEQRVIAAARAVGATRYVNALAAVSSTTVAALQSTGSSCCFSRTTAVRTATCCTPSPTPTRAPFAPTYSIIVNFRRETAGWPMLPTNC